MLFRKAKPDETKPKENRKRVREFFRKHEEKIKTAANITVLSALLGVGSISPPNSLKVYRYEGANREEIEDSLNKKGFGWDDKNYLFKITDYVTPRHLSKSQISWGGSIHGTIGENEEILLIALNDNFGREMLEFLGIAILERESNRGEEAIRLLRGILEKENANYLVSIAVKHYEKDKWDPVSHLSDLLAYEELGVELVGKVKEMFGVREYAGALANLKRLAENPNFEGRVGIDTAMRLKEIGEMVRSEYPRRSLWVYPILESYYSNPNFGKTGELENKEILDFCSSADECVKGLLGNRGAIEMLGSLVANPAFSKEDLKPELKKRIVGFLNSAPYGKGKYRLCKGNRICERIEAYPIHADIFLQGEKRSSTGMTANDLFLVLGYLDPTELSRIGECYPKAKKLAERLGAGKDVSTWANFAYAYSVLGPKKTEELYETFGIEFFLRYRSSSLIKTKIETLGSSVKFVYGVRQEETGENAKLLELIGRNIEEVGDKRPVLLLATAKSDWNGAFANIGTGEIEGKLLEDYRVLAIEAATDDELINRIKMVSSRYGKIKIMMLSGHGDPTSILLGESRMNKRRNSLASWDKKKISVLAGSFSHNAYIILNSCSTGAWKKGGIADTICKATKTKVFAPTRDVGVSRVQYDLEHGEMRVKYDDSERLAVFFDCTAKAKIEHITVGQILGGIRGGISGKRTAPAEHPDNAKLGVVYGKVYGGGPAFVDRVAQDNNELNALLMNTILRQNMMNMIVGAGFFRGPF